MPILSTSLRGMANGLGRGVSAARAAFSAGIGAGIQAFSGPGADGGPTSPLGGRWRAIGRSADADQVRALPRQRAESRELAATNPIAVGAIATNVNRVVGTGLQPVFAPVRSVLGWTEEQAAAWQEQAAREFSLWADGTACDLAGEHTFYQWQELVLRGRLESGDCFTNLPDGDTTPAQPYRLRLQLLEADRVGNPLNGTDTFGITAGVRFDPKTGRPLQYYLYDHHPGALLVAGAGDRLAGQWIDAIGRTGRRRILHHYRPTRPEQTRGVPYLAPVIQTIKDLGRYTEAEITAAVISAFFTTFVKSPNSASPAPVFGANGTDSGAGSPADANIELAAGAVIGLLPGEDIVTANPSRPNPNADAFIVGMLKLIGMGLGLPLELLVKRFDASYSASKAALLDAWMHFRTERAWLVQSACQPVAETWLAEAVAIGRISAPGFFADPLMRWAYTRINWHGDSQGSLNPKDEVAAYTAAIDASLMTRERAEWELFGSDWSRTYGTKLREHRQLKADDMLPAPKPGAAAAATPKPATDGAMPAAGA